MIKVYITAYWEDDISLFDTIKKLAFGKTTWKNLEFTTDNKFDKVVILNGANALSHTFPKEKAIVFRLEPPDSPNYLKSSESFVAPGYMHWPMLNRYPTHKMNDIYGVGRVKKSRLFSTVTSDLIYMDGHVERLKLIHFLDQKVSAGFDIWGRRTSDRFFSKITAYRGELENKFDGLLSYDYHLSVENSFIMDYFTEKITDAILAECYCFYSGCTNIFDYIDSRAFCSIDLNNIESASDMVIKYIHDNNRKANLKYIKQQKLRILTELNPLNLIWLILNERDYCREIKL